MPRGFLVKRAKKHHVEGAEEDRPEAGSGSDFDVPLQLCTQFYHYPYGSPDSGFSQSPVNLTTKDNRSHRGASPCGSSSSEEFAKTSQSPGSDRTSISTDDTHSKEHSPRHLNDAKVNANLAHYQPSKFTKSSLLPTTADLQKAANYSMPPHLMANPLSVATSAAYGSPFYFPAFDRLSVTSPKGQAFARTVPFLPPPGLFPGYPPYGLPPRPANTSAPSSPGDLSSPNKRKAADHANDTAPPSKPKSAKKPKAARKIHFDEDKSSPVSGTIIRDAADVDEDNGVRVVTGDIDSSLNYVEVTPEAREEIAKIENKIGAYVCQLCKENFEDVFQLAQHSCPRIVHVEYRCPECDKVFSCPANLASHRRWHKPRGTAANNNNSAAANNNNNGGSENTTKGKGAGPLKVAEAKRALDAINGNITNGHLHPTLFVDNKLARTEFMLNCGIENMIQQQQQQQSNNNRCVPSPDGQSDSEGQFECETCGKKFRRQAYLRKHMSTHSQSEPSLPCPVCGKVFRSETAHTKHMIQTHGTTPAPQLPLPPNPTTTGPVAKPLVSPPPVTLETHAALSLGARVTTADFTCALCGNALPSKLDLERHQRLQHPNEVYSCKYCTAVFYSSPGLTRHINKCHPSENRQVILLHMPQLPQINSPC